MNLSDKPVRIPAENLLLLTRRQEGSNWEGRGNLRAVHYDWELGLHTMNMLSIALERWAVQTPQLEYNQRAIFDSMQQPSIDAVNEAINSAKQSMADYSSGENSALVNPVGTVLKTFGGNLNPAAVEAVEALVTRRIQYAYLVQFLSLGINGQGARNVGETHQSFFYQSCANGLDYLAGRLSGPPRPGAGTIGRLVQLNFGEVDPRLLPRLSHSGLTAEPLAQAFNVLGQLKQHNLITDTNELEETILRLLRAGPLQESAQQLRAARHSYAVENPSKERAPTTEGTPNSKETG